MQETMVRAAAVLAALLLGAIALYQLLLAAGAPLGRAAWGGAHRVLPARLRLGSVAAAATLVVAGWIVLARAGLAAPGPAPLSVRAATWVSAAFFAVTAVGNAASESRAERLVMTPAAGMVAVVFAVVALFGP